MSGQPPTSKISVASCISGVVGLVALGLIIFFAVALGGLTSSVAFTGLAIWMLSSTTALVLGMRGGNEVRYSHGRLKGEGLANTGRNLGCAGLLLLLLGLFTMRPMGSRETSAQNRTVSMHGAVQAGLEQYKEKFGVYPLSAKKEIYVTIDGQAFDASGAMMLYQAITSDGNDFIQGSVDLIAPSDGKISEDERHRLTGFANLPKSAVLKTDGGYMLVDGYGHPFQYTPGGADSINTTYDLWSFGKAKPHLHADKAMKINPDLASDWIKNW